MCHLAGRCASISFVLCIWARSCREMERGRDGATIEFSEDGTFEAMDNQSMAVSGKYILLQNGRLRCEIQ